MTEIEIWIHTCSSLGIINKHPATVLTKRIAKKNFCAPIILLTCRNGSNDRFYVTARRSAFLGWFFSRRAS